MPVFFDAIALIGLLIALQTLWQWRRDWRQFWDDHISTFKDVWPRRRLPLPGLRLPAGVVEGEMLKR